MRVSVIGSRSLSVANLGDYLPKETTEIILGVLLNYLIKFNPP